MAQGGGAALIDDAHGERANLEALVRKNGIQREEQRQEERQGREDAANEAYAAGRLPFSPWSADLVLREESGFELWLGSLEDALSLEPLREHGTSALLNVALESCRAEVACFQRPALGGRARSHTRGASLMDDMMAMESSPPALNRDQVWAVASFDDDWYSESLEREVLYYTIPADDHDDYEMDQHFPEIIDYLLQCRRENRKVLVHCVMGINRAPTAVVAFLCGGMGMSLEAAVDTVSRSRGHILSNRSFIKQLIRSYGQDCGQAGAPNGASIAVAGGDKPASGATREVAGTGSATPPAQGGHTMVAAAAAVGEGGRRRQQVSFQEPPAPAETTAAAAVERGEERSSCWQQSSSAALGKVVQGAS